MVVACETPSKEKKEEEGEQASCRRGTGQSSGGQQKLEAEQKAGCTGDAMNVPFILEVVRY